MQCSRDLPGTDINGLRQDVWRTGIANWCEDQAGSTIVDMKTLCVAQSARNKYVSNAGDPLSVDGAVIGAVIGLTRAQFFPGIGRLWRSPCVCRHWIADAITDSQEPLSRDFGMRRMRKKAAYCTP